MKVIVLFFSFLIMGCAQMSVNLKDSDIKPFKEFSSVKKLNNTLGPFQLNVVDARSSEQARQIGFAYTGVKYKKTPVLIKKNVNDYIKEELTTEFARRNVLVEDQAERNVELIITKLSVNEYIEKHMPERAICEVEFQVKSTYLTKNFNARYWTEITSPGDLGDGTEKIAPTFASCVNVMANKIVEDPKFQSFLK